MYSDDGHLVLELELVVNGKLVRAYAMIDSGATSNFVDLAFVKAHGLPLEEKKTPRELIVVDGRPISSGAVTHHTLPLRASVLESYPLHSETLSLDVTSLGSYPIILGIPWLKKHEPTISWLTHAFSFLSDHCDECCLPPPEERKIRLPTTPAPTTLDKVPRRSRKPKPPLAQRVPHPATNLPPAPSARKKTPVAFINAAAFAQKAEQGGWRNVFVMTAAATGRATSRSEHVESPSEAFDIKAHVPAELHEFLPAFTKPSITDLPPHRPHDLKIETEPGTTPPFQPIYGNSKVELDTLKEFIDENVAKGTI